MASTISRWLLIGLLCMVAVNTIRAQTTCPPGMTPYGAGVCGYDNSQQQQQPQPPPKLPPRWISQWGAIATDATKGSLGTATNMVSKNEAEQVALADCRSKGGLQCKVDVSYDNECAVLIVGATGYNVSANATLDKATQHGMKICSAGGDNTCQVYYSACSLPVQIQ